MLRAIITLASGRIPKARKGELMHERHADDAATQPTEDDHIIHLKPEDRECFSNLLLNPPPPTVAFETIKRARQKGVFKLIT
jgi:hypothetical protein